MNKLSNSRMLQMIAAGKRRFISVAMLPLALMVAGMLAGCATDSSSRNDALVAQAAKAGVMAAKTNE